MVKERMIAHVGGHAEWNTYYMYGQVYWKDRYVNPLGHWKIVHWVINTVPAKIHIFSSSRGNDTLWVKYECKRGS